MNTGSFNKGCKYNVGIVQNKHHRQVGACKEQLISHYKRKYSGDVSKRLEMMAEIKMMDNSEVYAKYEEVFPKKDN